MLAVYPATTHSDFTNTLPAARYIQSRGRDYISLTQDMAEAPATDGVKDLGYCKFTCNTVTHGDQTQHFRGITEVSAYILRKFW